jgi:hypothetical protein
LAHDTVSGVVIRFAGGEADVAFLGRMLCWAADWEPAQLDEIVLERPEVARRLFDANEPGYSFVHGRTPD